MSPEILCPFEKGDVVTLRSGGAKMTVTRTEPASMPGEPTLVTCSWFEGHGASSVIRIFRFEPSMLSLHSRRTIEPTENGGKR